MTAATRRHGRVRRRLHARRDPAGLLRRQRPDAGGGLRRRARSRVTGPCEVDRRRPLPGRPGRQPARLPGRPARASSGTGRPTSNVVDTPRLRQAQGAQDQPVRAGRPTPSSSAAPTSTRSAGCPRPTRPARSWPTPTRTSGPGSIDRLLDRPEFADFWALKWADLLRNEEKTMGEKGVWVFQRWLRDQIAARRPARRVRPPDRRRPGLDLAAIRPRASTGPTATR